MGKIVYYLIITTLMSIIVLMPTIYIIRDYDSIISQYRLDSEVVTEIPIVFLTETNGNINFEITDDLMEKENSSEKPLFESTKVISGTISSPNKTEASCTYDLVYKFTSEDKYIIANDGVDDTKKEFTLQIKSKCLINENDSSEDACSSEKTTIYNLDEKNIASGQNIKGLVNKDGQVTLLKNGLITVGPESKTTIVYYATVRFYNIPSIEQRTRLVNKKYSSYIGFENIVC